MEYIIKPVEKNHEKVRSAYTSYFLLVSIFIVNSIPELNPKDANFDEAKAKAFLAQQELHNTEITPIFDPNNDDYAVEIVSKLYSDINSGKQQQWPIIYKFHLTPKKSKFAAAKCNE
ncbi:hypothetical protein QYM36_002995 [Artemia franciscana]|uniref:Uncharacterized protein n=1 Tax=Artemia franciscana TaxID=6661 RepID=A0AA88IE82_ARTSF|nr:hypothetical protein QYM36_002995 [Artemia franciscana]